MTKLDVGPLFISKTLIFKSKDHIPLGKKAKLILKCAIPKIKRALIRDEGGLYPNFILIYCLGEKKPVSKL